jgi:hypothetical protein
LRSSQFQTLSREGASFSTFASHNPRIVCRGERVYLNFTDCGIDGTRRVRFMESEDGGRSYSAFDVQPAGDQDVRPVGMAISKAGDLLAITPELHTADMERGRNWLLSRFAASAGGGMRPVSVQPMGRHGTTNFSVHYEVRNNLLYYASIIDSSRIVRRPNLFAIDAGTGKILFRRAITRSVGFAGIHYPYLATSADRLFLAWTSWSPAAKRYDGVSVMRSDDGGHNWLSLAGVRHRLPVDSRPQGPADGVILREDVGASTWLANMCVSGQALHFYYCARSDGAAERPCYRRYDLVANQWDHLIEPRWGGATLAINGLDGVFIRGLRLVAIGNQSGAAVVAISSDDNGQTWTDLAKIPLESGCFPYGIHACRTGSNDIVGVFTAVPAQARNGPCSVVAFRIERVDGDGHDWLEAAPEMEAPQS